MLTIQKVLHYRNIETSALYLVNQLLHCPTKSYLNNNGTFWDIGADLAWHIRDIKKQIKHQTFSFQPYHKRTKTMKNKKVRDLYAPTWRDRFVERWLSESLNHLLHDWFSKSSYAYRSREFGLDACQWKIFKTITNQSFIIKRDITNCFYTVDHETLLNTLRTIIDPNDYLFKLIRQRIEYDYYTTEDSEIKRSTIGVPFGSSIACVLANIALTSIDKQIEALPVHYFRYADDFLVVTDNKDLAVKTAQLIDAAFSELRFGSKSSHRLNLSFGYDDGFEHVNKFKYLGLEFRANRNVRLCVEKQRKILRLIKEAIDYSVPNRVTKLVDRVQQCVDAVNSVLNGRIRSVAIIDYYLKHVTDEAQLKQLDLLVAQAVICKVLRKKKFRFSDFSKVRYKTLRDAGLMSLVHRHRLLIQGHINNRFLSIRNKLITDRFDYLHQKRKHRFESIKMSQKIRKAQHAQEKEDQRDTAQGPCSGDRTAESTASSSTRKTAN